MKYLNIYILCFPIIDFLPKIFYHKNEPKIFNHKNESFIFIQYNLLKFGESILETLCNLFS